jgi:hypothetical protein
MNGKVQTSPLGFKGGVLTPRYQGGGFEKFPKPPPPIKFRSRAKVQLHSPLSQCTKEPFKAVYTLLGSTNKKGATIVTPSLQL